MEIKAIILVRNLEVFSGWRPKLNKDANGTGFVPELGLLANGMSRAVLHTNEDYVAENLKGLVDGGYIGFKPVTVTFNPFQGAETVPPIDAMLSVFGPKRSHAYREVSSGKDVMYFGIQDKPIDLDDKPTPPKAEPGLSAWPFHLFGNTD